MAVLWLGQFSTVTLNVVLGVLFVLAKGDFCGSVFETQLGELKLKMSEPDSQALFGYIFKRKNVNSFSISPSDHSLFGHVIYTIVVVDEFECQIKCMGNNSCKSINVHPGHSIGQRICELNNTTRQMKPGDLRRMKGSTYYSSIRVGTNLYGYRCGNCSPKYSVNLVF